MKLGANVLRLNTNSGPMDQMDMRQGMIDDMHRLKLNNTIRNGHELCRGILQKLYILQLKISLKVYPFSDSQHTNTGIFI